MYNARVQTQPVCSLVAISIQVHAFFLVSSFRRWCLLSFNAFPAKRWAPNKRLPLTQKSSSSLNYSPGFNWPQIKGLYQCTQTRIRRTETKQRHVCVYFVFLAQSRTESTRAPVASSSSQTSGSWKTLNLKAARYRAQESRGALMRLQWPLVVIARYCIAHAPHYYFINLSGSSFILER